MTNNATWLCPISSARRLPYGENCADWRTGCPFAASPNATGAGYLRNQATTAAPGIGISEIAESVTTRNELKGRTE